MRQADGNRRPLFLVLLAPALAAAVTLSVTILDDLLGGPVPLVAVVPYANAALSVVCGAAGGLLRRDELAFRILYTLPCGLAALMIHGLTLMLGLIAL